MEGRVLNGTLPTARRHTQPPSVENAGGTPTSAQGKPEAQTPPGNPKKSHGHTVGSASQRYALIQLMAQQYSYPIQDLCQVLGMPRSSYYAWRHRRPGPRAGQNQRLRETLCALFVANRKVYGSPRLTLCLQEQGIPCSRNRVARHMRELQLKARQKRAFKPKTTDSSHPHPIAPNRLTTSPKPKATNRV